MQRTSLVPWTSAWDAALYGPGGFFMTQRPADHFRTSVHVDAFADAIATLAQSIGAKTVVDWGAGQGELLASLRPLLPGVELVAVERAARPGGLEASITWAHELPEVIDGLLLAHELFDNVPVDVVEFHGTPQRVLVDPATGTEELGEPIASPWLERWWPLSREGQRAEIGAARDQMWADACQRVRGMAIAVDYGHLHEDRPELGSLRAYLGGRDAEVIPDGSRDVTSHVAVDSMASACGGFVLRQRDALKQLGITGSRPALSLADQDPLGYVAALGRASHEGELLARPGLGDHWWIVADRAGHGTLEP